MPREFKNIALIGLYTDARVAEPMQTIAGHLTKAGIRTIAVGDNADALGVEPVDEASVESEADLIIAVGGDGTMLHAASLTGKQDVPLLGINRGRLGFLTDVSPAEMLESLDEIMSGNYSIESRLRLKALLEIAGAERRTARALNDVVMQRKDTGRMLDIETRIAGRYVNTHRGDGLIVATPTGSTAYALSCGGPIIEPQLDAIVMVPVCPHTLSDRPVVIPSDHPIDVVLLEREDTNAEVIVDGHWLGELTPRDRLTITGSAAPVSLIHPPGYDYYAILRSKLHWGRDRRQSIDAGSDAC